MKSPFVSIVIPVYNVEQWLEECIQSILPITLFTYEVILVNDGSTDTSLEIAEKFAALHPDIVKVISQKNQGMAAARNTGLASAKGEYISFVDSDDFIDAQRFEDLVEIAKSSKADITMGKAKACWGIQFDNFRELNTEIAELAIGKTHNGISFFSQMLNRNANNIVVWDKIYKRSVIFDNKIQFLNGLIHEDVPFNFEAFISSQRVCFCDVSFYFYRQRDGSIMHSLDKKSAVSRLKLTQYLMELTQRKAIDEVAFNNYFVYQLTRASEYITIPVQNVIMRLMRRKLSFKKRLMLCRLMLLKN